MALASIILGTWGLTLSHCALVVFSVGSDGLPLRELLLVLQERFDKLFTKPIDDITKLDLYKDPCLLIAGQKPQTFPMEFKTLLWEVITNVGSKKLPLDWRGLKFNNTITTNGYKVDLHYTTPEEYYTTRFTKGTKRRQKEKTEDFPYVHQLDETDRAELQQKRKAFGDPGKGNIMYFSDGEKGGKRLRYTAVQRRFETYQKRNREELEMMMDYRDDEGVSYRETIAKLGDGQSSSRKRCTNESVGQ